MKKKILFSYFGFECKQIASVFYMYIDMGGRIAGKQDRPSLIIEGLQGPSNSQILYIFFQDGEEVITSVTGVHVPMYWDMNISSQ